VRGAGVGDAPVRDDVAPFLHAGHVRIEPELVAADVETDVEGLVKVRLDAEQLRVPLLGLGDVVDVIDDCPQSFEHAAPPVCTR
jgi:hypothetical protein